MSKSSLIAGVLLGVAIHVAVFFPLAKSENTPPEPNKPRPVAIAPIPPEPEPEPEPTTPAPPKPKPLPKLPDPPTPKPESELAKIHQPKPDPDPPATPGDTHADKPQKVDDGDVPPLRIAWDSPAELHEVARSLGMRVVAVNADGEVVREVALQPDSVQAIEFDGKLGAYSNRVRTLPTDFFGPALARQLGPQVRSLWILVPVAVDRTWLGIQKQAIAHSGLAASRIRELEGEFRRSHGRYQLTVTRIYRSPN